MTNLDLDALDRKTKVATPGPWLDGGENVQAAALGRGYSGRVTGCVASYVSAVDSAYIAAMSPDVCRVLTALIRVAEAERDALKARVAELEARNEDAAYVRRTSDG